MDGLSFGGFVFGIAATAVNPPATAACPPVAMVSASSVPGSRRCTWISKNPGATTSPEASNTGMSEALVYPTARIFPSRMTMSPIACNRREGSTSRPFLITRSMSHQEQKENGHTHGDAGGNLIENNRIWTVSHIGRDLNAAIDRTRMHDDDVGLRAVYAVSGQS